MIFEVVGVYLNQSAIASKRQRSLRPVKTAILLPSAIQLFLGIKQQRLCGSSPVRCIIKATWYGAGCNTYSRGME
jgi:hypothetical protein